MYDNTRGKLSAEQWPHYLGLQLQSGGVHLSGQLCEGPHPAILALQQPLQLVQAEVSFFKQMLQHTDVHRCLQGEVSNMKMG